MDVQVRSQLGQSTFGHCPSCTCHVASAALGRVSYSLEEINTAIEHSNSRLKHIFEDLSHLRTLRNACFPVNRLPPELLAEIFLCYEEKHVQSDCLRLLSVCRAWRKAGLACKALWSRIYCWPNQRVDLFLRLSGTVPLEMDLKIPETAQSSALPSGYPSPQDWRLIATNHGHRFWDLSMSFQCLRLLPMDEYCRSLNRPGEQLARLTLENFSEEEWDPWEAKSPRLQTSLFVGKMPQLETLNVMGIPWPWNVAFYSGLANLTNLTPEDIPGDWTVEQVLSSIECLPLLIWLNLARSLGRANDEPIPLRLQSLVNLPNLLGLTIIEETARMSLLLLQGLILPSRCRVALSDGELDTDQEASAALILQLQRLARRATFATLRISFPQLSLSSSFHAGPNLPEDRSILSIRAPFTAGDANSFDKVLIFSALYSASNVHTLRLKLGSARQSVPEGFLTSLLAGVRGVHTLIVEDLCHVSNGLFGLISGALPQLEKLVLHIIPDFGSAHMETQTFGRLAAAVEARVSQGNVTLLKIRVVDDETAPEPKPGHRLRTRLSEVRGGVVEEDGA